MQQAEGARCQRIPTTVDFNLWKERPLRTDEDGKVIPKAGVWSLGTKRLSFTDTIPNWATLARFRRDTDEKNPALHILVDVFVSGFLEPSAEYRPGPLSIHLLAICTETRSYVLRG